MIKNDSSEIVEPEEVWEEWKDGDDTALYDAGYAAGIEHAIKFIDIALNRPDNDLAIMPTKFLLKLMKHSILSDEEDED